MKLIEAKIVVLGTQGVGKTSIVSRYTGKVFNKHVSPTIGATFFCCTLTLDDYRVKLKIWDTAGQERFRAMAPMYYRNSNAAFLVYDITSYESYMEMKTWVEELQRNIEEFVFICILGNKSDLMIKREVKPEEAQEYANSIGAAFVETSAVTNEAVEKAFIELAGGLIRMSKNASSGMRVFSSIDGGLLATTNSSLPVTKGSESPNMGRRVLIPPPSSSHEDEKPPTLCC